MKENNTDLQSISTEGEGQLVEFKEKTSGLDREIVAFSNASGGRIFLGICDNGKIKGLTISNSLKSQIQDIAHNCDPSIRISIVIHNRESVIEIQVEEGFDKPYRCREGFFIRNGASSQKLRRNEILDVILQKVRFDEALNNRFTYPNDFSNKRLEAYLSICHIKHDDNVSVEDRLFSIGAGQPHKDGFKLTNAGVLFFANNPQQYFPESYITCVRYKGSDRFSIYDKKDFKGSLSEQIEAGLDFLSRHIITGISIDPPNLSRHTRTEDYPLIALREALINAITHRDYVYDGTHIYIHLFSDRIEIENPGGLCHGMSVEKLGQRSVRRNRLIADMLHRAGYIERVGSGFSRIAQALLENKNPPIDVDATNFFLLRFYPRAAEEHLLNLTNRQIKLHQAFIEKHQLTQNDVTRILSVSRDTAIRDLKALINSGQVEKIGTGRATYYKIIQ